VIKEKSDKEIMREIQAIMRQVNSCISFLPCLEEPCKQKRRKQCRHCLTENNTLFHLRT
jgi:hypothetical protein